MISPLGIHPHSAVRTKIAVILINVAERVFPQYWPGLMQEIVSEWMQAPFARQDLLLRTLEGIVSDVIDTDFCAALPALRRQEIAAGVVAAQDLLLPTCYSYLLYCAGQLEQGAGAGPHTQGQGMEALRLVLEKCLTVLRDSPSLRLPADVIKDWVKLYRDRSLQAAQALSQHLVGLLGNARELLEAVQQQQGSGLGQGQGLVQRGRLNPTPAAKNAFKSLCGELEMLHYVYAPLLLTLLPPDARGAKGPGSAAAAGSSSGKDETSHLSDEEDAVVRACAVAPFLAAFLESTVVRLVIAWDKDNTTITTASGSAYTEAVTASFCGAVVALLCLPEPSAVKMSLLVAQQLLDLCLVDARFVHTVAREAYSAVLAVLLQQEGWSVGMEWELMDFLLDVHLMLVLGEGRQPLCTEGGMGMGGGMDARISESGSHSVRSEWPQRILLSVTENMAGGGQHRLLLLEQQLRKEMSKKKRRNIMKDYIGEIIAGRANPGHTGQGQGLFNAALPAVLDVRHRLTKRSTKDPSAGVQAFDLSNLFGE
ncbi:hypothetical protein B484DRAFT_480028 [Ochromonadaceae sp. CCMP2298]|nr:hypothetical protein B484DRAFT_480028 [Ochromonadaceae sp. CCMP2298]